jgi:hypothetical protein
MGRGNTQVADNEVIYYVDYDNFQAFVQDEDGHDTTERDYEMESMLFDDWLLQFQDSSILSPHFEKEKSWIGEGRVLLSNKYYQIVAIDNEWSIGVALIRRDIDDYYKYTYVTEQEEAAYKKEQEDLFDKYNNLLLDALYELVSELRVPNGAWMSSKFERGKVEYCIMDKDNNNIDCHRTYGDAIYFAKQNEKADTIKRVAYDLPDENKDEREISAETIWGKENE